MPTIHGNLSDWKTGKVMNAIHQCKSEKRNKKKLKEEEMLRCEGNKQKKTCCQSELLAFFILIEQNNEANKNLYHKTTSFKF